MVRRSASVILVLLLAPGFCRAQTVASGPHLPAAGGALSSAARVTVREFRFDGNHIFSSAELARVTAPFTNREITAEDLEEARRQLTLYYVNHGYINSGAVLRDQTVGNGIVTFTIVEGTLNTIQVSGNRHFRTGYLVDQIRQGTGTQFNVVKTRDTLEILRQNPNIRRINAEVQPGVHLGEAVLRVGVEEANPYRLGLEVDNHRPASVGAERARLVMTNNNLTGRDDLLDIRAGLTRNGLSRTALSGVQDFALAYRSPTDPGHTSVQINYSKGDSSVIEEPFKTLDIASRSENVSFGLRQTMSRTVNGETAITLALEHRKSLTSLSGLPFSFTRGDVNGVSETTALRFGQEWLKRGPKQVVALRSLLSWGGGFPGSTDNPTAPNGRFVTWLGQSQYVRVLSGSGQQLVLRAGGQWANRALLSVEQFPIGGADSVRGYRENQLVRDKALVAAAELRFPVAHDKNGKEWLTLAPFADFGHGVNVAAPPSGEPNTISSAGLGLLYTPSDRLNAQVYWGHPFRRFNSTGHTLQERGIHFSVVWNLIRP